MVRLHAVARLCLWLAWWPCAVPQALAQPTARVIESVEDHGAYGIFFVVAEIGGAAVPNALDASRANSKDRGGRLAVVAHEHTLPAGKTPLTIRALRAGAGSQAHGSAPRGVSLAGGSAEFDLRAGERYWVKGTLDSYRHEVWLEDRHGRVLRGKFTHIDADMAKAMDGALYVATNLRHDDDWIDDSPLPSLPFVPVGSRLRVNAVRGDRAYVVIDGRKMRIGLEYGGKVETIDKLLARTTRKDDPRPMVAAWPEPIREAVQSGRAMPGMTREQVEVTLGRPRADLMPSTQATRWPYQLDAGETAYLVFGDDGLLQSFDGTPRARALLMLPPPEAVAAGGARLTAAGASAPAAASAPR